jgi:hypothetical protein
MSSVSNGLYFLTLPLISVMRVIYTSKGMSKKFGVRVIYRKTLYFKYLFKFHVLLVDGNLTMSKFDRIIAVWRLKSQVVKGTGHHENSEIHC